MSVQLARGLVQGDALRRTGVEQLPEPGRDPAIPRGPPAAPPDRRRCCRSRSWINVSRLSASSSSPGCPSTSCSWWMRCRSTGSMRPGCPRRPRSGPRRAPRVEVQHPLAETCGAAPSGRRAARAAAAASPRPGAVLAAVQVVPHGTVVDDQQRPGVVDVHSGTRASVKWAWNTSHDARDRWAPRGDLGPLVTQPSVQDRPAAIGLLIRSCVRQSLRTYKTRPHRRRHRGRVTDNEPSASTPRSPSCCGTTWRPGSG